MNRLIVGLTAIVIACGGGDHRSTGPLVDTLPGGAIAVDNGPLIHRQSVAPWSLVEDLRIGAMEGVGPTVFGEIFFLAVDAEGNIFVLDGQAQEVRIFDQAGVHVRTVANEGEGPGELRRAAGLAWDSHGNLVIWDPGNARYTIMTPEGQLIDTHRRSISGVAYPWLGRSIEGGLLDVGLDRPDRRGNFMGSTTRFHFIRLSPDFMREDTLAVIETPNDLINGEMPRPLAPRFTVGVAPDGTLWTGNTHEYRFVHRTFGGDTLRVVSLPLTPRPVTAAEKDSALAPYAQFAVGISPTEVYGEHALVQRLVPTPDGGLMVMAAALGKEQGRTLDVFDPSGAYRGRVTSPVPLDDRPPPQVHGPYLYSVVRDELDVEYVVRFRIMGY